MKKILLALCCIALFYDLISQNGDVGYNGNLSVPVFLYKSTCIRKNDTIFYFKIYLSKEKKDSIVSNGFATKLTKSKWITTKNEDGCYTILKYKTFKKKPQKNKENFPNNCECMPKGISKHFCSDGTIIKTYYLSRITYTKKGGSVPFW
jgi:hypothetical protein